MKKNSYFYSFMFVLLFVLTLVLFIWFTKSSYFVSTNNWIQQNRFLYILYLYAIKSVGIIWPPIPAGLFTMVSTPFLGWQTSYVVDLMGSITGGSLSYLLARKYGLVFLSKIFDQKTLEKIKNTKIKKGREIEAVFMYRILLGTVILEAVYYGAGLLKVNFWKFLIGAIASHIVVGIPMFILAQNIFGGKNIIITTSLVLISVFVVYKTKGRYFE